MTWDDGTTKSLNNYFNWLPPKAEKKVIDAQTLATRARWRDKYHRLKMRKEATRVNKHITLETGQTNSDRAPR